MKILSNYSSSALERSTLRLASGVSEAIDAECSYRPSNVSHKTWITEAVTERLARINSSFCSKSAKGTNG
ncbi:hypothetical protein B7R56_27365 [Pseudomonas savastanoi pv. retacarpa]|uniref:Uncharacterized protein n=2 Tax=Pseudomonas syringae group TaxID=136849 RepID=A0AB36KJI9_PSEUB|nr:hypothetical protein XJ28_31160 [Pseudomonas syringae pv. tomato]EEB56640.1 hypothetical protein PSPTOT1_4691 [Pseudomonas syringae pv. tomato T1]MBL3831885.1 hypothetical protein [Pseudomonas syringae pv. theae]OSR22719.1 hypothetical protein B7R56_27365 [Pseudomonas savastanoi pv. retacarpa]PAB37402.1 hypothetical protein CC202_01990 [Pseudomonas savastanoi]PPS29015.1 hypothetical protein BVY11_16340 [Pseudomonas amygdali pv. morsprunorum]QBI65870.1 hypothetical protein EIZ61_31225 [Pseu